MLNSLKALTLAVNLAFLTLTLPHIAGYHDVTAVGSDRYNLCLSTWHTKESHFSVKKWAQELSEHLHAVFEQATKYREIVKVITEPQCLSLKAPI